jgi:hypothetical protein
MAVQRPGSDGGDVSPRLPYAGLLTRFGTLHADRRGVSKRVEFRGDPRHEWRNVIAPHLP